MTRALSVFVAVALCPFAAGQDAKPHLTPYRIWTTADGVFTTTARIIDFKDGKAHLKKDDGKVAAVSPAALTRDDQQYIREEVARWRTTGKPAATAPADASAIDPKTTAAAKSLVRLWLRENLGDPQWDEIRWLVDRNKSGAIRVVLKYRTKNPLGAKAVFCDQWWIRDGKIGEYHANVPDYFADPDAETPPFIQFLQDVKDGKAK
jgi:hypothetical protein